MIYCNRTHKQVVLSRNRDYVFYSPDLDEDLYRFETHLVCSNQARDEAELFIKEGIIPDTFSTNKQLQDFASNYLKCGHFHLDSFKKLDVLKQDKLEYDEAVLLYILYKE